MTPNQHQTAPLVEHFFRHEAGRLVAVLTRIFGWRNFDLVEDMVQATLVDALQAWRHRGVPENPPGWVYRVARNKIVDSLRRDKTGQRVIAQWAGTLPAFREGFSGQFTDDQIEDSQLRMIFACCHPLLAREDQLALSLKSLCGFGSIEIARALLLKEETVKKRLQRARRQLIRHEVTLEAPEDTELDSRLTAVHHVLYLLFNEGYSPSKGDAAVQIDLCEEAVWLCHLLCSKDRFATPATHALMALMLFHAARLDARIDERGGFLRLEEQDRGTWDRGLIGRGREYLEKSAVGTVVTRFHLEAAIACHHCQASSYAGTDWPAILRLYDALLAMQRSPVYLLNRAIVVAEIEGPRAGLSALREAGRDPAMERYPLYEAALAELHMRAGEAAEARRHLEVARRKARSSHEREVIERRLAAWPAAAKRWAEHPRATLPGQEGRAC